MEGSLLILGETCSYKLEILDSGFVSHIQRTLFIPLRQLPLICIHYVSLEKRKTPMTAVPKIVFIYINHLYVSTAVFFLMISTLYTQSITKVG